MIQNFIKRPYEIPVGYYFSDEWWVFKDRLEIRNENFQLHSYEDKPAIIFFNSDGQKFREEYYLNGLVHRLNGPAVIEYYYGDTIKRLEYRINNYIHRDDGPALLLYDNLGRIISKEFYQNGKYHNDIGPAVLSYYNNKILNKRWYINNNLHRTDGPAVIRYSDLSGSNYKEEFYLFGEAIFKNYNKKAFVWNIIKNKARNIKRKFLFDNFKILNFDYDSIKNVCRYIT